MLTSYEWAKAASETAVPDLHPSLEERRGSCCFPNAEKNKASDHCYLKVSFSKRLSLFVSPCPDRAGIPCERGWEIFSSLSLLSNVKIRPHLNS